MHLTLILYQLMFNFVLMCYPDFRWVAMVAYGEGWHNNHHAFEYSARHGLEWWQLDPTWWTILGLGAIGLATKIKLPRPEHMKRLATKSS
jgi:stearoyl-CoA desaturase (delta-9 desaturase)